MMNGREVDAAMTMMKNSHSHIHFSSSTDQLKNSNQLQEDAKSSFKIEEDMIFFVFKTPKILLCSEL
jgi:hypothetical protein